MGSITFDSVGKVYDQEVVAVKDFNLEIHDGEFLTLVGPSGSGKSTLLRMVAGLEDVTSGTIKIGDEIVNKLPPRNRDIAMVFQSYALYPHLTVRDNMAFGLRRSTDLANDEIQERVKDAAKMMGIEELLDNKPKQLSGGQRQRVATGRAIVREPSVFLFDEPLSNLDAKLRKHMRIELQRLQEELGTTSIYVTHDQEEAMTMSDRIAILNHGELQQVGSPREVYTHPQNTFVAQFIGSPSMNMFNITFEGDSQAGYVTSDNHNFSIQLKPEQAQRLNNEGNQNNEYILGIRPEHISISHERSPNSIRAYVDIIEPLGDQDLLYFTFDPDSDSILTEKSPDEQTDSRDEENKAYIQPDTFSNTDEEIQLEFDLHQTHFFDAETQKRIKMPSTVEAKSVSKSDTTSSTS